MDASRSFARMSLKPIGWIGLLVLSMSGVSSADPVDLSAWMAESYPAVSGFGAGQWEVAPDNLSVRQTINGQPTVFYSDFSAFGTALAGQITVGGGDDDYVGFVIGFEPGDTMNASADYLLVDWKRNTQGFNFGAPSNTPGSTALRGLAVSRVTGLPTADEFWGHVNFPENPAGGLQELARGATLGDTGWAIGVTYLFEFDFTPTRLTVTVDGVPQMTVIGSFADGRLGFYNFSQANVVYNGFEVGASDIDDDGLIDELDNCILEANADQRDTDADGIGNACDPDIAPPPDGDCVVNFTDLTAMKLAFLATPTAPNWNPDADFNGDDLVNFTDLNTMKLLFLGPPGPSGLPNSCTVP